MTKNDSRGFNIRRYNDFESYKRLLFSPERLDIHEFLFLNLTMPSLVKQLETEQKNTTVFVVTSDELPSRYLKTLEDLGARFRWFKLLKISDLESMSDAIRANLNFSRPTLIASIRLDDDDALAVNFLEGVDKYLVQDYLDKCISFPRGISCFFSKEMKKITGMKHFSQSKIALGLTYISLFDPAEPNAFINIYDLGNHRLIDEVRPLVIDRSNLSFIRTCHIDSDTGGSSFERYKGDVFFELSEDLASSFILDSSFF